MRCASFKAGRAALAASFFAIFGLAGGAWGSISMFVLDSGVQADFGSQGPVYEASDPSGPTWLAPGVGPYSLSSPLPGVPAPPTPVIFPNPAGSAFGGGHTSIFNDLYFGGPTAAISTIYALANASPSVVSDAYISLPLMNLTQSLTAPSYAYEQLNVAADYGVVGGILGGSTPGLPLNVSGSVTGGSTNYAEFAGQLTYTWVPTNNTAFSASGPAVTLGTLSYSFSQIGGGSFATVINSTGTLAAAPTNWGLLEITGDLWVAGDPGSISVSTELPEPSSIGLMAFGLIALARRRSSRQRI